MVDEKKLELMKKLQKLAERGVGGEKTGAQEKLEKLMVKYGVEEADLSDDVLEDHEFTYKTPWERRLLRQLFYKIAPDKDKYTYRYGAGSRSKYGIRCTKAEAIQIEIEYEFYRELWKEEEHMFFKAFVQKHRIFNTDPDTCGEGEVMPSEEYVRMVMMMNGMQNKTPQQALEGEVEDEYAYRESGCDS